MKRDDSSDSAQGSFFRALHSSTTGRILLMAALVLFFGAPAFSQNCALCYTQAASSGARMIQALKSGILVLIIPPTLGSIGMLFVVHRKNSQVRRPDAGARTQQDW